MEKGVGGNRDMTWGGEHIMQCTDDVLKNCPPETHIILPTSISPNKINEKEKNF